MTIKLVITALLYVLTGGAIFSRIFGSHRLLVGLASAIAIGMSLIFWRDVYSTALDLMADRVREGSSAKTSTEQASPIEITWQDLALDMDKEGHEAWYEKWREENVVSTTEKNHTHKCKGDATCLQAKTFSKADNFDGKLVTIPGYLQPSNISSGSPQNSAYYYIVPYVTTPSHMHTPFPSVNQTIVMAAKWVQNLDLKDGTNILDIEAPAPIWFTGKLYTSGHIGTLASSYVLEPTEIERYVSP